MKASKRPAKRWRQEEEEERMPHTWEEESGLLHYLLPLKISKRELVYQEPERPGSGHLDFLYSQPQ